MTNARYILFSLFISMALYVDARTFTKGEEIYINVFHFQPPKIKNAPALMADALYPSIEAITPNLIIFGIVVCLT